MTADNNATTPAANDRRFRLIPLADMTPPQREVADALRSGPRAGTGAASLTDGAAPIGGPFNVWLRRPELANLLQQVGSHVRFKSSLPARLNELAILVTARHWTTQYEWFAHHRLALAAGLDPQLASDLAAGRRPANMQPDEALVHDFSHELHTTHGVSDATYAAVVERFGEAGAMDLIAVNGYYTLVSMTLNVDRTPLPGGATPPLAPLG